MTWFSQQYEALMPADADEAAQYEADLAQLAEHGEGTGPNDTQGAGQ